MIMTDLVWHRSAFLPPDPERLGQTLVAALCAAAERWGDRPALIHDGHWISFRDLAARVGGLADQLRSTKAAPGPVALLLPVGPDAVAAWIACAAAGRTVLILEPANPPQRIAQLSAAAGVGAVLCDASALPDLPSDIPGPRIIPDGRRGVLRPDIGLGVDAPALIFPTSGSTGTPKLITYSAYTMQVKVQASITLMGVTPGDVVLVAGSHGNFGFMHHALVFLLAGGCLCLSDVLRSGLKGMFDAILAHQVGHVRFTPSLFRIAAQMNEAREALARLSGVRFSGEPLLPADLMLARRVLRSDCRIQNVYGSTESALFIWTDNPANPVPDTSTVPIGQAYPLWDHAILGEDDDTADSVQEGELIISAPCQALGDWHHGIIDTRRFTPDLRGGGRRIYASGDIVRRMADGGLLILGRKNRMVKINGQRAFLTELESHLRAMPGCSQSAVVERPGLQGNRLVAFVTRAPDVAPPPDPAAWLATRLPRYMIPSRIEWIAQMPLLLGSKIDYGALLASISEPSAPIDQAVRHDSYGALCRLWMMVLECSDPDPDVDFFALGGDSLRLLELRVAVERDHGVSLDMELFLTEPSLRGLAHLLDIPSPDMTAHDCTPSAPILTLRPIRVARGISQGVALAMPGWGGSAIVQPWLEAGLFPDHDVWACDIKLPGGNMLQQQRWHIQTERLVAHLRVSAMPRPAIIFGYSVAGSMAWLADQYLGGSGRVVAVDARPMHRKGRYRTARLNRSLAALPSRNTQMLHLSRAWFAPQSSPQWQPHDARITTIGVPTVDHFDMIRPDVLQAAAQQINRFASGDTVESMQCAGHVATDGGRIFDLLVPGRGGDRADSAAMASRLPQTGGATSLIALHYLVLRDCDRDSALAFLSRVAQAYPTWRLTHYALQRLKRMRGADGPLPEIEQISFPLDSLDSVDHALGQRQGRATQRVWTGRVMDRAIARFRSLKARFPLVQFLSW